MLLSQVKCCLLTSSGFLTHLQSAGRPADSSQKDSEGLDKICGERCSPCTNTHNSKSKQASTTNSFFYPNCSTERSSSISNIASATGTSRIHGGCSKLSIPERWQKPCSHWKRKYIYMYICRRMVNKWSNLIFPPQAELLDAAAGVFIRFRLGGVRAKLRNVTNLPSSCASMIVQT